MNIPFPVEAFKKGSGVVSSIFKDLSLPKATKVIKVGAENIVKFGEVVKNSGSMVAGVYGKVRDNLSKLPEPPKLRELWDKIFPPKSKNLIKENIPVTTEKPVMATGKQSSIEKGSKLIPEDGTITPIPKESLSDDSTRLGETKDDKMIKEGEGGPGDESPEVVEEEKTELSEFGQYRNFIIEQAKVYMAVGGSQRHDMEIDVVKKLEEGGAGYEDVLLFIKSAGSIEARAWASELIWKMRQNGELKTFGLQPLSEEYINWANEVGVDKRMLAYCIDARAVAKKLILADPYIFYENLQNGVDEEYVENTLPNPGYMAMLLQTETGNPYSSEKWGYVYVGDGYASKEINEAPNAFPNSNEYLKKLAEHHQKTTGLPFYENWQYIPGSLRGDSSVNLSGGAIGPQFMPLNSVLFLEKYNQARKKIGNNNIPDLNLWDPYTGTILGYLYIASAFYARHGNLTPIKEYLRPGYIKGSDLAIREATKKWNPHAGQINQIVSAGYSYWEKFGGK